MSTIPCKDSIGVMETGPSQPPDLLRHSRHAFVAVMTVVATAGSIAALLTAVIAPARCPSSSSANLLCALPPLAAMRRAMSIICPCS